MTFRYRATVEPPWDADAFRDVARAGLLAGAPPDALDFDDTHAPSLFAAPSVLDAPAVHAEVRVPPRFVELAEKVVAHTEPQRFALLYRLLWRIVQGERRLLANSLDADVARAGALAQSVRRDLHKMKAFVRFRAVPGVDNSFVAWFEPEHRIVDLVAPFFMRRFAGMRWAILTPYRRAVWDGATLAFGDGARADEAPAPDAGDALWRAYYANIFNPARLNLRMMRQEMPVKYWRHLPEVHMLPTLVRDAPLRAQQMIERNAEPSRKPRMVAAAVRKRASTVAPAASLTALREAARDCRACPLWEPATATVFGEGPDTARIMVVGEQPGDQEDLLGKPFIGPAGQLFDRALGELGLDRSAWYVTNAVKHFKFEREGKHRLHKRPAIVEQTACRSWLDAERRALRPERIVCLGATALDNVLGRSLPLLEVRGQWLEAPDGTPVLATVHPAWVLRRRTPEAKTAAYRGFVADLAALRELPGAQGP